MKYKSILFIGLAFIFCGFTDKYIVTYNGKFLEERIEYNFYKNVYSIANEYATLEDGDFLENDIVFSDIKATSKKNYRKVFSNNTKVTLIADYTFNEFRDSNKINSCFEKVKIYETDKQYIINLSGNLICNNFKTFEFSYKGKIEANSDSVVDNVYIWNLKEKNDINILIKKQNEELTSILYILIILSTFGIVLGTYIVIKGKKNNKI